MSFVFLCPQLHSHFNQRQRRATHAPFPFIKAKQLLRNVWLTLHPITWERFFSLDVNSSRPLGRHLLPPVINYHAPQPNTDAIYSAYSKTMFQLISESLCLKVCGVNVAASSFKRQPWRLTDCFKRLFSCLQNGCILVKTRTDDAVWLKLT